MTRLDEPWAWWFQSEIIAISAYCCPQGETVGKWAIIHSTLGSVASYSATFDPVVNVILSPSHGPLEIK